MRSRNIKPGFFENEKLAELPALTRILFAGLWCYADREGRFEWRPKRIKALILPYDDCNVEEMLMSLHAAKFLYTYTTGNDMFGLLPKFKVHQNPHPHEAKSILPSPPENVEQIQCHDMSLQCNVMSRECNADILIPDILIPERATLSILPFSEKPENGDRAKVKQRHVYGKDFERAWSNHGRKDGSKYKAEKKWKHLTKIGELPSLDEILEAQDRAKQTTKWRDGYCPYFETWLNGRMWETAGEDAEPDPMGGWGK
jgi:hypothetical protein